MIKTTFATLIILFLSEVSIYSQTTLASIFSDNMVLQAENEIPVWGKGKPNSKVEVKFKNQRVNTMVNKFGSWKLKLLPEKYGGPYELSIISNDTITIHNVLVGEVWLFSGQSNMTMKVRDVSNGKKEIRNANYPNIRLCTIPLTLSPIPSETVQIKGWDECSSKTIKDFSAVAYFYGRELSKKLNVPIGLIHVSKGGTPIEAWMSKELFDGNLKYKEKIDFVASGSTEIFTQINTNYKKNYNEWLKYLLSIDQGLNADTNWYSDEKDFSDWEEMLIPNTWENEGLKGYDGIVWFKKEVELNGKYLGEDLQISLGRVQDMDITFFNGVKIGTQLSRDRISSYTIPKNLVKEGKNTISVLVLDNYGIGGLWEYYYPQFITNTKSDTISLKGKWYYKSSTNIGNLDYKKPRRPLVERYPTILFNGMIAPLIPFGIKGFVWYQGESNSPNAYEYRYLFESMIEDWRTKWPNKDLAFYFVQLANYKKHHVIPVDDSWAELRESQAYVLKLKNTGMVTAVDIGNEVDVHPKNKQEVGRRLALTALSKTYGENVEYSGPIYSDYYVSHDTVFIKFNNSQYGLMSKDGEMLREFTIAGVDKRFYNANAEVIGEKIAVWNKKISKPIAVRYAWQSNPTINLISKNGFPIFPFRTDSWKLSTQEFNNDKK